MDYRGRGYRLSADVGYQDHQLDKARPSVNVGAGLPVPAAPKPDANWAQPWTKSDERDTFGTLRGEVDLAPGVVAWAAIGARSGDESNLLALATTTNAAGDASMYRFDNVRKDTVRTGELGVRGDLRTGAVKHTLSASVSGFSQESRNAYGMSDWSGFATNLYRPVDVAAPAATFFTGGDMANPLVTQKTNLSSFAVADTMSFADGRVLLVAGARRQRIKDYGYDYNPGIESARYDESKLTPVAALVYKPLKNLSLYANYAEALQQGPVAAGANIDNVGEVFAPTTSRQKEVGVKYDAGRVGMTAALFTISQPMAFVQDRHFGVFGEQRNRGLELSAFGMPVKGLRVLGGLTLLDAEQRSTAGGVDEGKDVIGVPRTQLNLGTEWDVPGVAGLALNARALYTSGQYADSSNAQKLPSWNRLDLGASYRTRIADRDVTLRARVDNVTDRSYWASAGGYPGAGYLVQGAPRTVAVSGTLDF
jgi:iron complex outermembrane receptor protein